MMDGVAYLIKMKYKTDKIGQNISSEEKRKIYVSERALTRTEYFKAGQNGMNPRIC